MRDGPVVRLSSEKCLQAGLRPSQDERMYVVRALVCVHGFQIDHVTDHFVFFGNAVAAVHDAGRAGDIECLAAS